MKGKVIEVIQRCVLQVIGFNRMFELMNECRNEGFIGYQVGFICFILLKVIGVKIGCQYLNYFSQVIDDQFYSLVQNGF